MPDLLVALLAAGASSRLGQPKQLIPVRGEPLLRRQCRTALEAGIGPVVVILGCNADTYAAVVADLPIQICLNPQWPEGLASSVRTAVIEATERKSRGILLFQVDQYRLTAQDLRTLHDAWDQCQGQKACRSCFESYTGPPVVLPEALFGAALALTGDEGARKLLAKLNGEALTDTEVPNAAYDLDTPDDLAALNKGFSTVHLNQSSRWAIR